MQWQKISLVGVGLLGGSLGLAIRQRRLAARVVGYVRRRESVEECLQAGAVDEATTDLASAVSGADLVVLCTPLAQMRALTEQLLPSLRRGALVTDVGSVKSGVTRDLTPLVAGAGARFVGSHPMAGAEKMGVRASRPDLFVNAVCVITPQPDTPKDAVESLGSFWESVGARVMLLSPEAHDEFVSRSSHLVHVVAAALAGYVLNPVHPEQQALLCANGFRDTTRVASGSPEMWRDIALANQVELSRSLRHCIAELEQIDRAIRNGDAVAIEAFFARAKERRDLWSARSASPSPE